MNYSHTKLFVHRETVEGEGRMGKRVLRTVEANGESGAGARDRGRRRLTWRLRSERKALAAAVDFSFPSENQEHRVSQDGHWWCGTS